MPLSFKSTLCSLLSESMAVSISHLQLAPTCSTLSVEIAGGTLQKEKAAVCWLSARWRGGATSGSALVACSLLASSLLAWPRDTSPPSWQAHHTPPGLTSLWLACSLPTLFIHTHHQPQSTWSPKGCFHLLVLFTVSSPSAYPQGNASCLPSDWTVMVQATLTFSPGDSALAVKVVSHALLPAASREGSQHGVMPSDTEV